MPVLESDSIDNDPRYPGSEPTPPPQLELSSQLQLMMMSIRNQASGSYGGKYQQEGGAYGVPSGSWDAMARRAGLDGADIRDKAMQDYVAAWTMKAYYAKYQNWALVALAWQKGSGATDNIIKSLNRDPMSIHSWEIDNFYEDATVNNVMADMGKLGYKGITGQSDVTPTLGQVQLPTQVITGTGRVNVEDTYNATVRALVDELSAEEAAAQPSAAEMLFSQMDMWSQSIAGGARADYRTDVTSVQAEKGQATGPGSKQELEPMKIEERT